MYPSAAVFLCSSVEYTSMGTIATTAIQLSQAYAVTSFTGTVTDAAQKRRSLHSRNAPLLSALLMALYICLGRKLQVLRPKLTG